MIIVSDLFKPGLGWKGGDLCRFFASVVFLLCVISVFFVVLVRCLREWLPVAKYMCLFLR